MSVLWVFVSDSIEGIFQLIGLFGLLGCFDLIFLLQNDSFPLAWIEIIGG